MVRFIILYEIDRCNNNERFTFQYGQIYYNETLCRIFFETFIYIPIWLDLLSKIYSNVNFDYIHLHSNMVRFIIEDINQVGQEIEAFTFQYGQIYYVVLLYIMPPISPNLHSNMVRFIIHTKPFYKCDEYLFTFQYGQIYYFN